MVDDTRIVLDTAAKEGIETILFETPEKFIHQLRGKNIL